MRRRFRVAALSACIVGVGIAGHVNPASAVSSWGPYNWHDPDFCDTATVRGEPAQLAHLPQLREVPASERLPFAPATVSIQAYDEFQVGDGWLGFQLRQTEGRRTRPLGMLAIATFARIDYRGRVLKVLNRTQQTHISTLKGYETLSLSSEVNTPGLYRSDISFQSPSGASLGRYGAYTRVLPLRMRPPRLVLNARQFLPGEKVLARVENFSQGWISYGVPYSIQRWDGSAWTRAPESPRSFIKPLYGSGPGSTGPCLPFGISTTMPAGTYRMVKSIRTSGGPQTLHAEFGLIASALPRR